MAGTYSLTWYEDEKNIQPLVQNAWQLQLAHTVTTGDGPSISNMIWKSLVPNPLNVLSWHSDYALNWSAASSSPGISITVGGSWQPCNLGDVFDLDATGEWIPSTQPAQPGWLKVGNIKFRYGNGLHIVIGIKNSDRGSYEPIFMDPAGLTVNGSAAYQPQNQLKWWLQGGNRASQPYQNTKGAVGSGTFELPQTPTEGPEWWTTFDFPTGEWRNSRSAPDGHAAATFSMEAMERLEPEMLKNQIIEVVEPVKMTDEVEA